MAAFHEDAVGPGKTVTVRTFPKPELGRPENVSITTVNSTVGKPREKDSFIAYFLASSTIMFIQKE